MKNKFSQIIVLICLFPALSCKKDPHSAQVQPQQHVSNLENGLVNFSINGELVVAAIDTTFNTITVTMPDSINYNNLTANFTLTSQVSAAANNTAVNSGFVFDFTKPVNFTISSANKKRATTFKVIVQTKLQYFGLAGNIVASKSLNKDYNFYFDQFDGSVFQSINCGPTVTTMAIKWSDSTFTKTPVYARSQYKSKGGWWLTGDVQAYLQDNGISNVVDTLSNLDSLIKKNIDRNNLVILCLDMYYVPYFPADYMHVDKFYIANTKGWGHFLLVKGYKQSDNNTFYIEIYDPYSGGKRYSILDSGQLMGKDRYYISNDIRIATNNWWPYAIVLAPKGQKVTSSTNLTVNSIGKSKVIPEGSGR